MNWDPFVREALQPLRGRGRPGPRLVRGLLWAVVAIFVISILAFWFGQSMVSGPLFP
jgi:hypothetical protein